MSTRAFRAGGAALVAVLLLAGPALADDSGEFTDNKLDIVQVLFRFVLIPVALLLVIGALAAVPRLLRRPRYRPGRPWNYDPIWFAGPDDPEPAIAAARPLRGTGGASADW